MVIHGLQKTTLLDYPSKVAATIFFGSCNFRCPFCHNMNLVLAPDEEPVIPEEEIFSFLRSRHGILDGVCITGGEPTLQKDLPDFIRSIKELGFAVKLDTNGSNPGLLRSLVSDGLLDYVAMDIKSSKEQYPRICNVPGLSTEPIEESVSFLLQDPVPYEFRTTIVKEYHTAEVMEQIGEWIDGAAACYLQSFVSSAYVPDQTLHECTKEELQHFQSILRPHVQNVSLRGVE